MRSWIPIDKNFRYFFPLDRPFTRLEAMVSYTLDMDEKKTISVSGYSKLWQWSRNKVRKFLKEVNTAKGHFGDRIGTERGQSVVLINNGLWENKDRKRTGRGQEEDTTIKPNTNTSNKKDMFLKPTIEELEIYAKQIDYDLNAESFFNSYEQKNWMVGKNKMKDWKAAVRNWKANKWGEKPESRKDLFY